MIKKIVICLIILLTLGCSKEVKEEYKEDDIKVSILEDTLTDSGLTFEIKNNTDSDIMLEPGFDIEKYSDNSFKKLSKNKKCSSGIGYGIEKNNMMDIKVNWSCEYGKLNSGKYRIIKYLENDEYLIIDFELQVI